MNEDQDQTPQEQVSEQHVDLENVKQRAQSALAPLMGEVEMEAERKFDICMSAIRMTDNRDLVEVALEAALAIEAKGTKAEALVELINEISYLQQNQNN